VKKKKKKKEKGRRARQHFARGIDRKELEFSPRSDGGGEGEDPWVLMTSSYVGDGTAGTESGRGGGKKRSPFG